jgi:hypothetical protein
MKQKTNRKFGGLVGKEEITRVLKEKYPEISEKEMAMRIELEIKFQQKHLRAYLAGKKQFVFGRDGKGRKLYFDVTTIER